MPSFLGMIALLGLPSAVGFYSARRPDEARAMTVTAAGICLLVSLPVMLLGYLAMPWALSSQPAAVVQDARTYLWFVALQTVNVMPYMALQGLRRFEAWNVLRIAPNVAAVISLVVVYAMGTPRAGSLVRVYMLCYATIAPVAYLVLWRRSVAGRQANPRRVRELFAYGLPSAVMVPAGLLNLQLDQMVLAAWLPSKLLGLYAVGVSWSGLVSPIFGALGSVSFPTLAAAHNPDEQRAMVARTFRLAIVGVTVLGLGLAAVTPLLMPLLFGAAFRPAVPSALVLVAAGMVLNVNNLSGELLRGLGVPRWPMYSQFIALPVTILSLVVLLPRWSIVGAGVSSLLAYLVVAVVCLVGLRRSCRLTFSQLIPGWQDVQELLRILHRFLPGQRGRAR